MEGMVREKTGSECRLRYFLRKLISVDRGAPAKKHKWGLLCCVTLRNHPHDLSCEEGWEKMILDPVEAGRLVERVLGCCEGQPESHHYMLSVMKNKTGVRPPPSRS